MPLDFRVKRPVPPLKLMLIVWPALGVTVGALLYLMLALPTPAQYQRLFLGVSIYVGILTYVGVELMWYAPRWARPWSSMESGNR
jgi:hypothetical protein